MSKITLDLAATVKLAPRSRRWIALAAEVAEGSLPASVRRATLALTFCGDARMRSTNRLHRGKDSTTDVLSFPVQESVRSGKHLDWLAPGEIALGDLLISVPRARLQARQFGVSLDEELVHLFFHGFLHLLGFDHEVSRREEKIMQTKEAELLEKFAKLRAKRNLK